MPTIRAVTHHHHHPQKPPHHQNSPLPSSSFYSFLLHLSRFRKKEYFFHKRKTTTDNSFNFCFVSRRRHKAINAPAKTRKRQREIVTSSSYHRFNVNTTMTHIYSIKIISSCIYIYLWACCFFGRFFFFFLIEKLEMNDQWQNGRRVAF